MTGPVSPDLKTKKRSDKFSPSDVDVLRLKAAEWSSDGATKLRLHKTRSAIVDAAHCCLDLRGGDPVGNRVCGTQPAFAPSAVYFMLLVYSISWDVFLSRLAFIFHSSPLCCRANGIPRLFVHCSSFQGRTHKQKRTMVRALYFSYFPSLPSVRK